MKRKTLNGYESRGFGPAQMMFRQFITYLTEPRKKHVHVDKSPGRVKSWGGGQGQREKSRRLRQIAAGKLSMARG